MTCGMIGLPARRSGTSLTRRCFIRTCVCPGRGMISSRPILTSTDTTSFRATCSVVLLAAVQSVFAADHELHVMGWNAQSGFSGANPTVIAERMAFIGGCDPWGSCEVQNESWAAELEHGAG